jgi:hypothetical protein
MYRPSGIDQVYMDFYGTCGCRSLWSPECTPLQCIISTLVVIKIKYTRPYAVHSCVYTHVYTVFLFTRAARASRGSGFLIKCFFPCGIRDLLEARYGGGVGRSQTLD